MTKTVCKAKNPATCWKHGSNLIPMTAAGVYGPAIAFSRELQAGTVNKFDYEVRKQAQTSAAELAYFPETRDTPELRQLLEVAGDKSDEHFAKITDAAKRSKAVLDFDKSYVKEHGFGHNPAKTAAISKEFGFSDVRYYQILTNNPEMKNAKDQVSTAYLDGDEPVDFITSREKERTISETAKQRLYNVNNAKKVPQSYRSKDEVKQAFDSWEAQHEAEQLQRTDGNRVWVDQSAEAKAEREYYTP